MTALGVILSLLSFHCSDSGGLLNDDVVLMSTFRSESLLDVWSDCFDVLSPLSPSRKKNMGMVNMICPLSLSLYCPSLFVYLRPSCPISFDTRWRPSRMRLTGRCRQQLPQRWTATVNSQQKLKLNCMKLCRWKTTNPLTFFTENNFSSVYAVVVGHRAIVRAEIFIVSFLND